MNLTQEPANKTMTKAEDELKELLSECSSLDDYAQQFESDKTSVRTTFNLSSEAIDTLDWLSNHTGQTHKDLLDEVLRLNQAVWEDQRDGLLETADTLTIEDAVRKSMAVRPETRTGLNELAAESDISRDALVELGIRLAKLLVQSSIEHQIASHQEILDDLEALHDRAEETRSRLTKQTGSDDPVDFALFGISQHLNNIIIDIEEEIRSGKPLEKRHTFI